MDLSELEEGDRILFNDRKTPLKVVAVEEEVEVEGPKGGEYNLYEEDGDLLVYTRNRRYSSYVRDLRKTGKWTRNGDTWKHTSGSTAEIKKNSIGYWTIETSGPEIEVPMYGYSDKEEAVKDLEKAISKNPEGFDE